MKTLLLASAVFAGLLGSLVAIPVPITYHAFCRSIWLFATPCTEIRTKLVQQIQAFEPQSGCAECLYRLVSDVPPAINANHTSLDGLQAQNVTFTLRTTVLTGGCSVAAKSTSLGFTLLDGGLNYCNLYNLLSASGLNSSLGFMEMTNEWSCLGYRLSTCKT